MMDTLVGRKVNLKVTPWKKEISGQTVEGVSYQLDDLDFEYLVEQTYGNNVRIKLPGKFYTQECKPFRKNINITKDGIVESVSNG